MLFFNEFNEIMMGSEKGSSTPRRECQMAGFRNFVDYCGIRDLSNSGHQFTCQRSSITERLDRLVADHGWCTLFLCASQQLPLDHKALLLTA